MARVVIITEGDAPREVELRPTNSIGRHPSQYIQLLDRLVSKEHAIIEARGDIWVIRDLGSRNGTFVNRRLVEGEAGLDNADEVLIGSTKLLFYDQTAHDTVRHKVTITPFTIQSNLHKEMPPEKAHEFLPEWKIQNVEMLRQDYERLRRAYELQEDIALELHLDSLLEKIFDYLFATLQVDRGVIMLYNEQNELVPRCIRKRDGSPVADEEEDEIAISKTILNKVIDDKSAVLSSDARVDSRFNAAESIIMQGIRSTMCVPLLAHDKLLGVIHLDNRMATGAFTEKDLSILQGLALQAAIAIENSFLVKRIEAEAVTRQQFERLLSPNLVEQVITGELAIEKGGEVRQVTVLFSDVRGFTELSENRPAREVVHMLNEYFEAAVEVIFQFDGTLDKFLGDGLMAIWGAPVHTDNDALNAVRAAVGMRKVLSELNESRVSEGLRPIDVGIGIDTGEIVAGYMGSSRTMSYTVIGPSVNRASRLCAVAGPSQVLISEETYRLIEKHAICEAMPAQQLKGIRGKVPCFNVTGIHTRKDTLPG
jgi:adenylate cyclase